LLSNRREHRAFLLIMRLNDTLTGFLLLLFGVGVALHARAFPVTPGQGIGPGFIPVAVGVGIAACGAVLVWSGRKQPAARWLEVESWVRQPRIALNGALVIGSLVFYALVVDTLGFFLTAFVFLVVLFIAFGVARRWTAPLAVVVTVGLHVAFYSLLRVPLPWGWLEGIAW
jgi:putative tricarboxylic transport membrane protein